MPLEAVKVPVAFVARRGDGTVDDFYELEASSDLANWTAVASVVADASGEGEDRLGAGEGAAGFYRLSLSP